MTNTKNINQLVDEINSMLDGNDVDNCLFALLATLDIFNRYYIRLEDKEFPDLPDFVKKYLEDSIKTIPVSSLSEEEL